MMKRTHDEEIKKIEQYETRLLAEYHHIESLYHRVCERERQAMVLVYKWKEEKSKSKRHDCTI
ncbi:hypothetical protein [Anoxybacillus sp. KU2-6(11)]|uniref:hypothetical protein n=1 Tax=Anoxybacillus sp. KU2-6(11) TaxID=1535751 RepID=UPI000B16ED32|nr:hypothetical protein [Anoxybacillus sp. KU2-6(11)]